MADPASVIKEFLVSLGFSVNESQFKKFNEGLLKTTEAVTKLGALTVSTGVAIELAVRKIADEYEKLYYTSQRVGASSQNIKNWAYASKQVGASLTTITDAAGALAQAFRTSPGYATIIQGMGIATRNTSGQLRDTVGITTDLIKKFKEWADSGHEVWGRMYADALHLDYEALRPLILGFDKANKAAQEHGKRWADIDYPKLEQQSIAFNNAWRKLSDTWDHVTTLLGERFLPIATSILDHITQFVEWSNKATKGMSDWQVTIIAIIGVFSGWRIAVLGVRFAIKALLGDLVAVKAAGGGGGLLGLLGVLGGAAGGGIDLAQDTSKIKQQTGHGGILSFFESLLLPKWATQPEKYTHHQHGGIVPIMAHAGEMVLPSGISEGLQGMFGGGDPRGRSALARLYDWLMGSTGSIPVVKLDQGTLLDLVELMGFGPQERTAGGLVSGTPGSTGGTGAIPIRPTAPGGKAASIKGNLAARAQQGMAMLMSGLGLTHTQAAGAIGWLIGESNLNPYDTNASGHTGIAQWDKNDRWPRFVGMNKTGQFGGDNRSFTDQMKYWMWELVNVEHASLKAIRSAKTVEEANYGTGLGERPGHGINYLGLDYARGLDRGSLVGTPATSGNKTATINQNNNIEVHGIDSASALEGFADAGRRTMGDAVRTLTPALQ